MVYDQDDVLEVADLRCDFVASILTFRSRRTKFRKQANAADNRAATMSVDSLINYEAVKVIISIVEPLPCAADVHFAQYFNNEKYEIAQYDDAMRDYTKASVKISTSLAALNSGQTIIFSTALTGMMFLAAQGVVNGPSLCLGVTTTC